MATTTIDPTHSVVEIRGLNKSYSLPGGKRFDAVADLDLTVRRGEIFGILGTNGAGKTTSVECAQGLRRPDGGVVRVLGCDPIAERGRLRGRVGSQLQDSNLPENLRVAEALNLFAHSAGQADRATDEWDLADLADRSFGKLSGGQRQRLFLALALLNDPEVVFLDELTQGLDPNARREVWQLIERVRDRGTTVVLVTHFMEEAEVLCDRVLVMAGGRSVDVGSPTELTHRHSAGMRMRFAGRAEDVAWLAEVPMVAAAHFDRGEIELRGPSPMVAHVGAALVTRDQVPSDIRIAQPTLEDALLTIIQGENR